MLSVKIRGLLLHIVNHCKRIENNLENADKEIYDSDENIRDVICFNLLQIGELVKGLDADFVNTYKDIPWGKIKGMHDRIAHGYGTMDMNRVWATVTEDVKPLRDYCEKILKSN